MNAPSVEAATEEGQTQGVGSGTLVRASLTPELQRHFPKLSRPRKPRRCRLCYGKIEIGEPCCRWEWLEPGEGYSTSYAHPECYQVTLDEKWDEGDWECCSPGDVTRPNNPVSHEGR